MKITRNQLEKIIIQNFINDAKAVLYSFQKIHRLEKTSFHWHESANEFGGDFNGLPDSVSYVDIKQFVEEYEDVQNNS